MKKPDTNLHFRCPQCGEYGSRSNFKVRSQYCLCGWSRKKGITKKDTKEGHQMTTPKQAKDVIDQLFSIIASAPELNMSNYDEDEVSDLNEAMTEAYHVLVNYYAKQKESTK